MYPNIMHRRLTCPSISLASRLKSSEKVGHSNANDMSLERLQSMDYRECGRESALHFAGWAETKMRTKGES